MVKNAFAKNTFREIKSSLGRYFAILLIIALGVGFFAGLRMTEPDMKKTAVKYLAGHKFYDYRLISTLGFTEEDVSAFSSLDGVTAAGSYTVDFIAQIADGGEKVYRAESITTGVNELNIISGRAPENADECVIDARYFSSDMIGKYIEVSAENDEDTLNTLKYDKYLIVGTALTPIYLNYERGSTTVGSGTISAFVCIPPDGFESEYYHGIYLLTDVAADAYSDEYDDLLEQNWHDKIENLLNERGDVRYEKIVADAEKEISDGEKTLAENEEKYLSEKADAEKKLSDALKEITDGEKKLADGKAELENKKKELSDGEKTIAEATEKLISSKKELSDKKAAAEKEFAAKREELSSQKTAAEQAIAYYTATGDSEKAAYYTSVLAQINAVLETLSQTEAETDKQLAAAEAEIEKNEKTLAEKQAEITAGKAEIKKAETEISEKEKTLADGKAEYEKNKKEADEKFADAEKEINDAKADIEQAKEDLSKVEKPTLYQLDRNSNIGYMCFENDSNIVEQVSVVFPMFFLLVAVLVCMTTMTRMVDECRGQIGIFKALGYSNAKIQSKFLVYSGSAALLGWLTGYFAGTLIIPHIIWSVYDIMYNFAPLEYVFDPVMFVICLAAALLCSCGAAYFTCLAELRPVPATLIRPKAPKEGKKVWIEKIPFIWKHLGFLKKVSARNIFRYKNRLFMMIVGIGGCTALLITGFGIRDSIKDVVALQFNEIMQYDISLSVSDGNKAYENVAAVEGVDKVLKVLSEADDAVNSSGMKSINLLVPEEGNFDGFVSFALDGKPVAEPKTGETIISTSVANALSVGIGDEITLRNGDYNEIKVTVSGIFDNYLYNYAVISAETYSSGFGKEPETNILYVNVSENADIRDISAKVGSCDGVAAVTVNEDLVTRVSSTMNSLNYIVLLVLVCAAALAFIVIYNLTNINIEERIREIATIKVLGFRKGEVAAYVMREIVVLTALGAVVGLPAGKLLHAFVMSCINVDQVTFQNKITPLSYILSLALTFVFALTVNIFMSKRLDKIDMATSLKSIE